MKRDTTPFFEALGLKEDSAIGAPGAALVVSKKGTTTTKFLGLADLEANIPVNEHTAFHVASLAKQFTALLIAHQIARRKICLETEIGDILTWLPERLRTCKIKHLLFHTSGIRDQWPLAYFSGLRAGDEILTSDVEWWASRQKELNFEPGTKFLYCNTGYTLLGLALEKLENLPFAALMQNEVFAPLGMRSSQIVTAPNAVILNRARGVTPTNDNTYKLSEPPYGVIGSTCLRTTPADMSRWLNTRQESPFFEEARKGGFFGQGALDDGTPLKYGFGLIHTQIDGHNLLHHGGFDFGFNAVIIRCEEQKASLFACGCGSYSKLEKAGLDFFAALLQNSTSPDYSNKKEPQTLASAPPTAGIYASADFSDVREIFYSDNGTPHFRWLQTNALRLAHGATYLVVGSQLTVTVVNDEQIVVKNGADEIYLSRVPIEETDEDALCGNFYCDALESTAKITKTANGLTIQFGRNPPEPLTVVSGKLLRWGSYWAVTSKTHAQIDTLKVSHPRCLNVAFSRV